MRRMVALFMFLLLGTNASGHHSRAAYDMSEALEMEGELVSLIWRNPHIRLSIKVVDENSAEKIWTIEGWGSLYTLKRTTSEKTIMQDACQTRVLRSPNSKTGPIWLF